MVSVIVTRVLKNVGPEHDFVSRRSANHTARLRRRPPLSTAPAAGTSSRHVTWPLLAPTTLVISIVTVVGSLKVFDHIYLMTGGGPENATLVLAYYIYERAFEFFEVGYASSLAVVLFFVTLGLTPGAVVYEEGGQLEMQQALTQPSASWQQSNGPALCAAVVEKDLLVPGADRARHSFCVSLYLDAVRFIENARVRSPPSRRR